MVRPSFMQEMIQATIAFGTNQFDLQCLTKLVCKVLAVC